MHVLKSLGDAQNDFLSLTVVLDFSFVFFKTSIDAQFQYQVEITLIWETGVEFGEVGMVEEEMSLDAQNELVDILDDWLVDLLEGEEEASGTMTSSVDFSEAAFSNH